MRLKTVKISTMFPTLLLPILCVICIVLWYHNSSKKRLTWKLGKTSICVVLWWFLFWFALFSILLASIILHPSIAGLLCWLLWSSFLWLPLFCILPSPVFCAGFSSGFFASILLGSIILHIAGLLCWLSSGFFGLHFSIAGLLCWFIFWLSLFSILPSPVFYAAFSSGFYRFPFLHRRSSISSSSNLLSSFFSIWFVFSSSARRQVYRKLVSRGQFLLAASPD